MKTLYVDRKEATTGERFLVKRGTYYDCLQHDGFFRMCDNRGEHGIAKVVECVVIRFSDIKNWMLKNQKHDHLWKDMMTEHTSFDRDEIVTIVYYSVHHQYGSKEDG